jgi:hypothetical protein
MQAVRFIARFDSASAMVQATARYLHGQDFSGLGILRSSKLLMPLVNALPARLRQYLYRFGGWYEGVPPHWLGRVRAEALSQWVVDQYPRRQYPAVMIGSSNGAIVHLCCALGIPWLPQTLLLPVRRSHVHGDEMRQIVDATRRPAHALLQANPDLQLHQMHDPNQDRLMSQEMAYFRIKRLRLGETYTRFLEETLLPGGTLLLVECQLTWPTNHVAERHVFQAGGLGGISPEEYLYGSEQVAAFLRDHGSHRQHWEPPAPDGERPEAEWGFEPALREDVEELARRRGYRVQRIGFHHPQDMSPLVADFYRWWYRQRGLPAQRLLAESFILLEPWWVLRTGSVPYWSFFPVQPAAASMEQYLATRDPYDDIRIILFSHGIESIGVAPIERWRALLKYARRGGGFLGVDEDAFPRDFATFVRYHRDIRTIPDRYPLPGAGTNTAVLVVFYTSGA